MDKILSVALGIVIVIIIAMQGANAVARNTETVNVNNYLEETAKIISESNYNAQVIQECITEAADNGYTLVVDIYGSGPGAERYADITLQYHYGNDVKEKRKIV